MVTGIEKSSMARCTCYNRIETVASNYSWSLNTKFGEMVLRRASQRNSAICLIGIDGSGKTTHALRIVSNLQQSGAKSKYVWFGTPYFLSYPFMVICRVLGLTETHHLQNGLTVSEHRYYLNKPVALIFPWIQFLDLSVFVFSRVYLAIFLGFTVVCDRFVHDTLSELMADVNDDALDRRIIGRLILGLKPRRASVFLLDVDEVTALRRRPDVPSLKYLAQRRKNLLTISKHADVQVINANDGFSSIHERLTNSSGRNCE